MLSSFLTESEPNSMSSVFAKKEPRLAPKFGKTLADEGSEHELLERLSNISSQSSKSKSKRNLPRPSNIQNNDDLLSYITNDTGKSSKVALKLQAFYLETSSGFQLKHEATDTKSQIVPRETMTKTLSI